MRRVLLLLVALGAAVTVVVAPARSPGPVGDEYLGVSSSVIACPELAVTEDSAAVLSGLVAVTERSERRPLSLRGTTARARPPCAGSTARPTWRGSRRPGSR